MLRNSPLPFVALATGFFILAGFAGALAFSQDDKFAKCPDPEAAKQFVQSCMAQNPYNTREVCEQRALEELCGQKKQ
jgi:hypothetical protein